MKKLSILLICAMLFCGSFAAWAQPTGVPPGKKKYHPAVEPGQAYLTLGLGLFPTYLKDKGRTIVPPVDLSADYMLSKQFSLGLMAGRSIAESRPSSSARDQGLRWENRTYYAGLRAAAHSQPLDYWGIYGGFMFGYYLHDLTPDFSRMTVELDRSVPASSHQRQQIAYTGYVGVRYLSSRRLMASAEIGYGVSLLRLGLGYQFR